MNPKSITSEIDPMIFKKNPEALLFMKQTDDLVKSAIEVNPHVIKYVKNQRLDYCIQSLKIDYRSIAHIKKHTEEIQQVALGINPETKKMLRTEASMAGV